jgi:hypothetical protein
MPYRYSVVFLLILFGLFACASKNDPHHEERQTFTTEIHSDGSKRFVLAIVYQQDKPGGGARGQRSPEGKKGRGGGRTRDGQSGRGRPNSEQSSSQGAIIDRGEAGYDEDKRDEIMDLLDQKLAETDFCRHGFIELDYSQMRGKTELVGECQESASQEDIERWDS